MEKYIDHRLVARPEPDNTFWDDSTLNTALGERRTVLRVHFDQNFREIIMKLDFYCFMR